MLAHESNKSKQISVLIFLSVVGTNLLASPSSKNITKSSKVNKLKKPVKTAPMSAKILDNNLANEQFLEAINQGDPELVAKAIANGANVNDSSFSHIPILHQAIVAGRDQADKIVKLLLAAGAKVDSKDMLGKTALMLAADSHRKNAGKIAQLLIKYKANLNLTDTEGQAALEIAQKAGNQAVLTQIQAAIAAG